MQVVSIDGGFESELQQLQQHFGGYPGAFARAWGLPSSHWCFAGSKVDVFLGEEKRPILFSRLSERLNIGMFQFCSNWGWHDEPSSEASARKDFPWSEEKAPGVERAIEIWQCQETTKETRGFGTRCFGGFFLLAMFFLGIPLLSHKTSGHFAQADFCAEPGSDPECQGETQGGA